MDSKKKLSNEWNGIILRTFYNLRTSYTLVLVIFPADLWSSFIIPFYQAPKRFANLLQSLCSTSEMLRCEGDSRVLGLGDLAKIPVCNLPRETHFGHLEISISEKLWEWAPDHFGNCWTGQRFVDCATGVGTVRRGLGSQNTLGTSQGRWRRGDRGGPYPSPSLLWNLYLNKKFLCSICGKSVWSQKNIVLSPISTYATGIDFPYRHLGLPISLMVCLSHNSTCEAPSSGTGTS